MDSRKLGASVVISLCLAGTVGTADQPTAPAAFSVTPEWHRSTFGPEIGAAGLYVVDLAGTGNKRVVATASASPYRNRFWYVLVHQGGEYVHEWTSPPYVDPIAALRVANLDGDAALEVVVAAGNRIYVYDGATHLLQRSFATAASVILAAEVADVDSDGQQEIILCDSIRLYVYNAASGAAEYASATGLGGIDLAVGNVDLDPAREIVIAGYYSSSPGLVVDGQTHAMEWSNPWGFGSQVALGDLDGDGRSEAVAGHSQELRIFDVELQSLAATVPIGSYANALQVTDVEGDGPLEIVYRDGSGGHIWVLDGSSRAVKWSVPDPDGGVGEVSFGDSDNDGTTELVWGSGSWIPSRLNVWNAVIRLPEWTSLDVVGPFQALSWGDVDGDGEPEIVSGSFESEAGDGLWFVHDARTHAEEFQSGPTTGSNSTGLSRIRHTNIDADPQQEIFVATSVYSTGLIICYDGVSHGEQWRAALPSGSTIASMALGDVDLDGEQELVAGVEAQYGWGTFVLVFDAATGAEEWMSPSLGQYGFPSLLRVANVDGDPQPEILVGDLYGALFLIDEVTQVINHLGFHDLSALDTPDRNGDGAAEIVIGTPNGAIQVLDTQGTVVETIGNFGGRIDGLAVVDLDLDRHADYTFAVNNEVFIRSGADGSVLWQSGLIGDGVGAKDSLYVADVDEDGVQELLVNIGSTGFRLYGITTDRIFTDGFE